MADTVTPLGRSLIQHGPHNDRIYLMKLDPADLPGILDRLAELAERERYSKIFAKVPASAGEPFAAAGYETEARVPEFFAGHEECLFVSRFLDPARREETNAERHAEVLAAAEAKAGAADEPGEGENEFEIRRCAREDVPAMADIYARVFESYPFPIHDPAYIRRTMDSHVIYFGAWREGRLAALSSAEMDAEAGNIEMTDFATEPEHRGSGLATRLLATMEAEMRARGLKTAYTIARAVSFGMNITFAKMDYAFGGRLVNNTNIAGRYESMNVWYKPL